MCLSLTKQENKTLFSRACLVLQKHTNSTRPKPEAKSPVQSAKSKPTVLPNKAIKTAKIIKPSQGTGNVKQIILPSNFSNLQKTISMDSIRKLFSNGRNGESGDSANVLATLANIAEAASSGNSNIKQSNANNDAVAWLETHLASSGNDNSGHGHDSMLQSAIDIGQSVNLTEAGKLALSSLKRPQSASTSSTSSSASTRTIKTVKIQSGQSQTARTPLELLVSHMPAASRAPDKAGQPPSDTPNPVANAISRQPLHVLQALQAAIQQEIDKRQRKSST